jgi:Zn-dependent protease with chaperone function
MPLGSSCVCVTKDGSKFYGISVTRIPEPERPVKTSDAELWIPPEFGRVFVVLWLWYKEHEADIYSLKKLATAEPILSALMKLHAYNMFQRSGILQDWVELKVQPKRAESSLVFRKRDIFMLLFRESLETALKIIEISNLIKDPLPPTHLPLRLRIYKILRELENAPKGC